MGLIEEEDPDQREQDEDRHACGQGEAVEPPVDAAGLSQDLPAGPTGPRPS